MIRRRSLLASAAAGLGTPLVLAAPTAPAAKPLLPQLRIYIPGGAGGGWDQTGRTLGATMQALGLVEKVEYENKGGKGGTLGLADFVARFDKDPAALLVGGMVMVGALAIGDSKVSLSQVTPLARLTNDYLAVCTLPGSPFTDLRALVARLREQPASVAFTGGSLGSVDHMLVGMMLRHLQQDVAKMQYLPGTSAKESIAMMDAGKAQVLIAGLGEVKADLAAKRLVPLGVSARRSLRGIPALSSAGVPLELANWRGVFGPANAPAPARALLQDLVQRTADSALWNDTLKEHDWFPALAVGDAFRQALEIDQSIATVVTHMLKLRA
jgi:putative tricarboxylic transport membrane protein